MDASLENFVEEDLGGVTENSHNEEPVEETNFEEHHEEPVEDTILEEHEEEAVNETDLEAHDEEQVKDMKLEAPNEEPGKDNNSVPRVGEKRWPGWPGESVFRILIPAHKVGAIIGRKGEFIKKMCEESKARIKILDGPPGIPERAVMSADLRQEIQSSLSSQNRRTEYSSQRSVIEHQCCKFDLSPSNLCWMKILAKKLQMLPGNSITCLSDSFDTWTKLLIKIGTTKMFHEKIQEQFDCNKWRKRPSENAIP